jgi:hypothetical protein
MFYYTTLEKVVYDSVELFPSLVKNSLKKIKDIKKNFGREDTDIYCLFDNCQSAINIRKIISENKYKSNRDKNKVPAGFYKTLDLFYYLLEFYDNNLYLLRLSSNEADDLVDPLLKHLKPTVEDKALLISADMDWSRSIDSSVEWYNYVNIFTKENFEKNFGFVPTRDKIILYKTFKGDSSDNIKPAIPYLRKTDIMLIVNNFDSIDDLMNNLFSTSILKDDLKKKINNSIKQIKINEQLVSFFPIKGGVENLIVKCVENIPQLRMVFEIFGLELESRMIGDNGADFFKSRKKQRQKLRKY